MTKQRGALEGWGCKWLKSINRSIVWIFKADKMWQIDKEKILDTLKRETRLAQVDLCSVFSFEKVERIVESLPDEISLENSEHWEIEFEQNHDGLALEKLRDEIQVFPNVEASARIREHPRCPFRTFLLSRVSARST